MYYALFTILFAGAESACNIARVTGIYKGTSTITLQNGPATAVTEYNGEYGFSIPANTCVGLSYMNAVEFSASWKCVSDANGQYLAYYIYQDTSLCDNTPLNADPLATSLLSAIPQSYPSMYVFSSDTQAEAVIGDTLWKLGSVTYFKGEVSCGQASNCGMTVTQTIKTGATVNGAKCDGGSEVGRLTTSNVVSGLCIGTSEIDFDISETCTFLETIGVETTGKLDCTQQSFNAQTSFGYVCKEDALFFLTYDKANCAQDAQYVGLRINEMCVQVGLLFYELDISCGNPNDPGVLNVGSSAYKSGDQVTLEGNFAGRQSIFVAVLFCFIVYILQ